MPINGEVPYTGKFLQVQKFRQLRYSSTLFLHDKALGTSSVVLEKTR